MFTDWLTVGDAVCLTCASCSSFFSSTWSLQVYMCVRLPPNIKVNMERVCVSLIALTSMFSGEQGEFKSLMGPLHLFKVFPEKPPRGGVD